MLPEELGSAIKLPEHVTNRRDNWLPGQTPKVTFAALKQPTLAKA